MPEIYLLSTLLMGLLLIAVATAVSRSGQRATPSGHAGSRSGFAEWSGRADSDSSRVVTVASNPMTWTISFILLAIAFLAGVVLMFQGLPDSLGIDSSVVETGVLGLFGALLLGFVFAGSYFSARDRIGYAAAGIAIAAVAIGLLLLVGVVIMLLSA